MMKSSYAFAFMPVASFSPEHGDFQKIGLTWFEMLERLNGKMVHDKEIETDDPPFFLILTGGCENKVLEVIDSEKGNHNFPVFLIAHPNNNSLPASLEILARLKQDGVNGNIIFFSDPADIAGLAKLTDLTHHVSIYKKMKLSRIGLVGEPSDWLVASMQSSDIVKKTWGPKVVQINMEEMDESINHADSSKNLSVVEQFITHAEIISGPEQNDFKKSADVYTALQEAAEKHALNALTVRCFDIVERHKTTGCFALAQLNNDGIIAGCEGDLPSAIGMLWAKYLLNSHAWMANPAQIDPSKGFLRLAHCTIDFEMTDKFELFTHFETNIGIGIRGFVNAQPCTLLRIGGKNLDKIWITEGQIVGSGQSPLLCRTQLDVVTDDKEALEQLLKNPLGNHVVLVFGHHKALLTSYHKMFIAESEQN